MADCVDTANALSELHLAADIKNVKSSPLPFTGFCYNCNDELAVMRFCDADCRDDYQKREFMKHGQ